MFNAFITIGLIVAACIHFIKGNDVVGFLLLIMSSLNHLHGKLDDLNKKD